jgi:hypothetical protein
MASHQGYGGGGKTWVDDLRSAKIYAKIGGARGRVSFFAKNFPAYSAPRIVVLKVTEVEVLDEQPRIDAALLKRQRAQEKYQAQERQRKEDAERAEYERLAKKFGP